MGLFDWNNKHTNDEVNLNNSSELNEVDTETSNYTEDNIENNVETNDVDFSTEQLDYDNSLDSEEKTPDKKSGLFGFFSKKKNEIQEESVTEADNTLEKFDENEDIEYSDDEIELNTEEIINETSVNETETPVNETETQETEVENAVEDIDTKKKGILGLFKSKSKDNNESYTKDADTIEQVDDTIEQTANTEENFIDESDNIKTKKKKGLFGLFKKKDKADKSEDIASDNENEQDDDMSEYDEEEFSLIKNSDQRNLDINDQVEEIIEYFTQIKPGVLRDLDKGRITRATFESYVSEYIKDKITKDEEKQKVLFKEFDSFIFTYSILDPLIADDTISDIKCYDWDHIRIKRTGVREDSEVKFVNQKAYLRFVNRVAVKNKVNISDQNALQNFVDTKSSPDARLRFNISTGFVNSSEIPILQIRKTPKRKPTREQLIEAGFFTPEVADYLEKRVTEADGILFTGQGGSGKTTGMNYLIDFVPHTMSGLVIQENDEMFSYTHPDMIFQHTVINHGEGKIEYNLGDLARNGLLTDIDLFVIGEIKGSEALYLLNAVYTGAKGWASVHGASSLEAMNKLADYVKYASDYSQAEVLKMLTHLNTVVFMEKYKVKEIAEVVGYDEKKGDLIYKKIL